MKRERLLMLLKTIMRETEPIEGHTDPRAIKDCWGEVFEMIDDLGIEIMNARDFILDNTKQSHIVRTKQIELNNWAATDKIRLVN